MPRIQELDHGFRHRYLDYATLTAQLEAWSQAFPGIVHLQSIGTTPEERSIWLLTIGREPRRTRPAAWVDGNMHGTELAGSSVALAIAESVLRIHMEPERAGEDFPPPLVEALRAVHLYVAPRLSPDGAEAVLAHGGFIRSVPRASDPDRPGARWRRMDLDGDGRCRQLRVRDAAGDFVPSSVFPGLMLPRDPDDPPPYYRLYPEGEIEGYDGFSIPEPDPLSDTPDLNRNFPWDWRPEAEQTGAGAYPGSEPESEAVLRFAAAHPNLFAWLNLHTFGGVFIRPLGAAPDSRMDAGDRRLYRQLATWAQAYTGYPTVSGYTEFTYEPEQPLHGDLTDFAYHQRGCLAEVCELWDLFRRIDMPEQARFVDHYTAAARIDMENLARWDADHNDGRIFRDWQPLEHPQLGPVEVGGLDPVTGIWNPPPETLPAICEGVAAYWLRVAGLLPRLVVEEVVVSHLDERLLEVTVTIANHGYLATNGIPSSHGLPWNHGVTAELDPRDCHLAHPQQARRELGALDGWGDGQGSSSHMPWFQRSRGSNHRRQVTWLIRGEGTLELSVGNARLGWWQQTVVAR
ncbi:M14 family metallopeptidase [Aquisalimonas lutea]|uniref:M14 family metallopeptidase n=1 Tax=Aquisalimonas lutea TaxID=1327750 RepID=UPI0025B3F629|nr:M14 family metallopeptidase [Aquisalimonas lutea]MDN3517003.1 M14 family metallopeptidase [Aquisalimonas lutea]